MQALEIDVSDKLIEVDLHSYPLINIKGDTATLMEIVPTFPSFTAMSRGTKRS